MAPPGFESRAGAEKAVTVATLSVWGLVWNPVVKYFLAPVGALNHYPLKRCGDPGAVRLVPVFPQGFS
jgi:hypothetical protein